MLGVGHRAGGLELGSGGGYMFSLPNVGMAAVERLQYTQGLFRLKVDIYENIFINLPQTRGSYSYSSHF